MLECGHGHGSRRSPRVLEFHPEVDAAVTRRFALRSEHMCFNVDQHAAIASYDKLPGGDAQLAGAQKGFVVELLVFGFVRSLGAA